VGDAETIESGGGMRLSRVVVRTHVLLVLGLALVSSAASPRASAQTADSSQSPASAASHATTAASDQASAKPPEPHVDTAKIAQRLNRELGFDLEATTSGWQHALDRLDNELARPRLRYAELNRFRDELQQLRSGIGDTWGKIEPRLNADREQIKLLGPVPAAGQPPEPDQTAAGRAELNYHFGLLSAAEAAVNANNVRVDNLFDKIQDIRRKNFTSALFQPIPGLYSYDTWANLPLYLPDAAHRIRTLVGNWWNDPQNRADASYAALEALLILLLLSILSWRGIRRLRRWQGDGEPPYWRRASAAAGVILLRALPVVAPVVFLYAMIASSQNLPERLDWLFYLTAQSIVIVFVVGALVTTAFAPRAPQWRLIAVSDARAARICGLVLSLAFVYSLTSLLYGVTRLVQAPFALTIAVALPSSLLLSGIVVALLRTTRGGDADAAPTARLFRIIRVIVWIIVAATVVGSLTGYLPLARFLGQQLIVTGSILALVYLLLLWVDGFVHWLGDDDTAVGRWLSNSSRPEWREQLALPLSLIMKFAVLVLAVPFLMLQWGYSWPDIREWYRQLFFGLRIGSTEVTIGALLASIVVFGLGYAAARLFQGWLDAQVLRPAGISGGVRNSIRTGVGYVGIIIAAVVAFSYAGFNLSSLAIVAGALSVGIGFGLQNLVNNFVSGIILLAERPIRVGDLVLAGGEQGHVRKISVRSTEIETADGANVLIPNSFFISEKVKNWTFRNNISRITISIGVAYGSDPRQVRAAMLGVAQKHAEVLRMPAPAVTLDEFGAANIGFTLYAFVADVEKAGSIRTDLAIAILDAFAAAGIAVPSGQNEITIRNLDRLRETIADHATSRPESAPNGGSKSSSDSAVAPAK
jgi:potassium-dependent mechanosensitive channel